MKKLKVWIKDRCWKHPDSQMKSSCFVIILIKDSIHTEDARKRNLKHNVGNIVLCHRSNNSRMQNFNKITKLFYNRKFYNANSKHYISNPIFVDHVNCMCIAKEQKNLEIVNKKENN